MESLVRSQNIIHILYVRFGGTIPDPDRETMTATQDWKERKGKRRRKLTENARVPRTMVLVH